MYFCMKGRNNQFRLILSEKENSADVLKTKRQSYKMNFVSKKSKLVLNTQMVRYFNKD